MKVATLCLVLLTFAAWSLQQDIQLYGGYMNPMQNLPVDPNYVQTAAFGTRAHGEIQLHIWGPSTLNVTEFNTTVLGNSASDVLFRFDIDQGVIHNANFTNIPGPYNFGTVTKARVSGFVEFSREYHYQLDYLLHIVRGPAISDIEVSISVAGDLKRTFANYEITAKIFTSAIAYVNVVPVPSKPYQYIFGVSEAKSGSVTVGTSYRGLSSDNWASPTCCSAPVNSFSVVGEIIEKLVEGNTMTGRVNLRTNAVVNPLVVSNATFSAPFITSYREPGMYTFRKMYVVAQNGTRYFVKNLLGFE